MRISRPAWGPGDETISITFAVMSGIAQAGEVLRKKKTVERPPSA